MSSSELDNPDTAARLVIAEALAAGAEVLTLTGEIDLFTTPRLRTALDTALAQPQPIPIVVDLSRVTFLGSAAVAVLIDAHTRAQQHLRPLRLVADPAAVMVTRPLDTTGAAALMTIYPTLAAALAPG